MTEKGVEKPGAVPGFALALHSCLISQPTASVGGECVNEGDDTSYDDWHEYNIPSRSLEGSAGCWEGRPSAAPVRANPHFHMHCITGG